MQVSISTRIPYSLAQWLDEYSKKSEIPKTQVITKALEAYKKEIEKGGK